MTRERFTLLIESMLLAIFSVFFALFHNFLLDEEWYAWLSVK